MYLKDKKERVVNTEHISFFRPGHDPYSSEPYDYSYCVITILGNEDEIAFYFNYHELCKLLGVGQLPNRTGKAIAVDL